MNEELLVDYYWSSLKQASACLDLLQEKGEPPSAEGKLIRAIAAAGVLRHGAKFDRIEPEAGEKGKEKKIGFLTITTDAGETEKLPARIVVKSPDGAEYSLTEDDLRRVMHGEYDRVVLGKKDGPAVAAAPVPIAVPDLPDTEETETVLETPEEMDAEIFEEESEPRDAARLPEFKKDARFPDDPEGRKADETFLFNRHDITLTVQDQTGTIHFYVYPLGVKEDEKATDIFVIAESGEVCRVGISRGVASSVELEFADIPFVARGSFEGGNFISQVTPLDETVLPSVSMECVPHPAKKRTAMTFARLHFHGIDLNIFPAKFKNNGSTGYSPAAIAIERNGTLELLTPTPEGPFALTGNEGETISVETYWVGSGDNPEFRVEAEEE